PAERGEDPPPGAVVPAGGRRVRARWAFDSRPAAPRRPGLTTLVQHFRGWTVRFPEPCLDTGRPPRRGSSRPRAGRRVAVSLSASCRPCSAGRALGGYAEFSRARLRSAAYDAALDGYLRARWS